MKKVLKWFEERQVLSCIILAFLLNLIIEMLSRKSMILGLKHMIFSPHVFLYNVSFILCTLSISFLFKRRYFIAMLISAIWLGLGIANRVLLSYRTTPLGAIDFKIVKSALSIMPVYLNIFEIILIGVLTLLAVALIVFLWFKLPKKTPNYVKSLATTSTSILLMILVTVFFINKSYLSTSFKNLANAYRDYGFVYCFSCTMVDRGIDRPKDYSKDAIDEILTEIEDKEVANGEQNGGVTNPVDDGANKVDSPFESEEKKPNIIFLQLESFYDVNYMKGVTYSEDPIPVFRHLKDKYSSGFLTVPSVGAGTANTEFEVISGMSLEFFGPGEYPYTTILKESTCETINYNLKELGYKTHAIHNHTGTFYDRNIVYSQLGFDTFTSLEYMSNVEYNPIGWAKDNVLPNEIMKALKSTKEKDHVYAISVQGHGKYPNEVVDTTQSITVEGIREDIKIPFEYYVNQLNDMDEFIGGLISTLESFDEPTVLVMFGDHLPSFDISNEELENNDIFQTEYVIWNNIDLEVEDKDLYSYQLSSNVLNKLGITNGVLTKFHKNNIDKENYIHELEMLEHDMLYGEKVIYNGVNPYAPTQLEMGIDDMSVHTVSVIEKSAYIIGNNFTKWSHVFVNGKKQETKFIDKNILIAENVDVKSGDIITICQIADDKTTLSISEEYVIK
ncbi:MAG TPA: arylsulfatase [Clostridiales bacterium]|nr:arylsulfatase [Clostridiales bacterium]